MWVKVCGLTRPQDVAAAVAAGADAIGLILVDRSPRRLDPARAAQLAAVAKGRAAVVVLVEGSPQEAVAAAARIGADIVQPYGAEADAIAREAIAKGFEVVMPTAVGQGGPSLSNLPAGARPLLDSSVGGESGGTGISFDWSKGLGIDGAIVAGGLGPDNVAAAIGAAAPWGVDASSRLEVEVGIKDHGKVAAFVAAARAAASAIESETGMTVLHPPTTQGRFGDFGGRFAPETLMPALLELEAAFTEAWADTAFRTELDELLTTYVGRPTPVFRAARLSDKLGLDLWLKREDLAHTGAHKVNNTIGQALLAKRMGKPRVIAETGAGQHGVATATACALLGIDCVVYMGAKDIERQALNVYRMQLMGAEVVSVEKGAATLKDAVSEAMRDWVATVESTHYIIGSVVGPHPFPLIVRELQKIIGEELQNQLDGSAGRPEPDVIVACVGGGSNSIGIFHPYRDSGVDLVGVEAAGHGIATGSHGASLVAGSPGVLHGARTYMLQDQQGQVLEAHSISAGLDYPGVGPEHSFYRDAGIARYVAVTDEDALAALREMSAVEGIIPALESAHGLAWIMAAAGELQGKTVVLNLSGRGDKDVQQIAKFGG